MRVYFHEAFYSEYTSDPAAESGRIEPVIKELKDSHDIIEAAPATEEQLLAAHSPEHIQSVKQSGLYDIAALAAGGAVQAANTGLSEPAFGLIRPPGHHASHDSCWGFCYFNNIAVAILDLNNSELINEAFILDFDLHYGDGTVNILGGEKWVTILNPSSNSRRPYLDEIEKKLSESRFDIIGISAGFDHHVDDWGGLLTTDDYTTIGLIIKRISIEKSAGVFAVLEGGYNHSVLGKNVSALLSGLENSGNQLSVS